MAFFGKFIVWYGVIFGILDWLSDIIYILTKTDIDSPSLTNAVVAFIVVQPVWYFFIHFLYLASNTEVESTRDRLRLIFLSPIYAIL